MRISDWSSDVCSSDLSSQNGAAAIFTAPVATSSARTVTIDLAGTERHSFKVYVVTGADNASPVGASGEGSSTANAVTPNAYTSTVAGNIGNATARDKVGQYG